MSKILFASEIPTNALTENPRFVRKTTDYDFIIAPFCLEDEAYMTHYKIRSRRGAYLDNGAFENGVAMPTKEYLEIYNELDIDYLVVPDVRQNYKETLKRASSFLVNLPRDIKRTQLMGVLQGTSVKEYEELLKFYIKHGIFFIGISYGTINRIKFIYDHPQVKFHVLGLPYAPELLSLRLLPNIVSLDTSLPSKFTAKGLLIEDHDVLTIEERPKGNRFEKINWTLLKANLDYLHSLCNRDLKINSKKCTKKK